MKKIYLTLPLILLFLGCSSNVFDPKVVIGKRSLTAEYDKKITMQHLEGITYDDGKVVTLAGEVAKVTLPKEFAFLNETKKYLIAADNGGQILLIEKDNGQQKKITFTHRVLSANMDGELLAVVTVKNSMQVYDISKEKLLFKFASSEVIAVDSRLANPVFNQGLIFFPSLDGKVQIYSKDQKKMIRTMSISTEDK
ncbi:MAG: PQQ-like beta-propeller repeat protein, partial [Thiovulaceae bacterium]|nr:PQQ-like beta-propeller repeat protein [Sulfurimonadaceae bacterium]